MPSHKNLNKTQEVIRHLERYKSIDRATATSLFSVYDLCDIIRRIRAKNGYETIETVKGSAPNTRYRLKLNQ